MRCSAASRRASVSASGRVSWLGVGMGFLAKLKRRWRILQHIAEETKSAEQHFPYAALTGIGFNAVWWAAIEHEIDLLVFWHACTRLGESRNDHPRALVNKLRYMKTMERDETLSDEDRVEVRRLRLRLADVSKRRHDFTHSFMDIANPTADWPFSRFRYEGKNLRLVKKTYDIGQLAALTEEIRQLVGEVSPFLERLALPWMNNNRNLFASSSAEKPRP